MHILGEIDADRLLFYSFTDRQMFTYSLKKMAIQCVRMLITPMPTVFQQAGTMQDQVKFLALHPKFHQPGNNFVII